MEERINLVKQLNRLTSSTYTSNFSLIFFPLTNSIAAEHHHRSKDININDVVKKKKDVIIKLACFTALLPASATTSTYSYYLQELFKVFPISNVRFQT